MRCMPFRDQKNRVMVDPPELRPETNRRSGRTALLTAVFARYLRVAFQSTRMIAEISLATAVSMAAGDGKPLQRGMARMCLLTGHFWAEPQTGETPWQTRRIKRSRTLASPTKRRRSVSGPDKIRMTRIRPRTQNAASAKIHNTIRATSRRTILNPRPSDSAL